MELNYPDHKHPHDVEDVEPNPHRIWACDECDCIFSDDEIRKDIAKGEWGHKCPKDPHEACQCESHLEPYLPEIVTT